MRGDTHRLAVESHLDVLAESIRDDHPCAVLQLSRARALEEVISRVSLERDLAIVKSQLSERVVPEESLTADLVAVVQPLGRHGK